LFVIYGAHVFLLVICIELTG